MYCKYSMNVISLHNPLHISSDRRNILTFMALSCCRHHNNNDGLSCRSLSFFSLPLAEKTDRGDSFFCLCFFHWNGQGLHYSVPDIRFTEWCNTPIKLWQIGRVPSGSCALIGQATLFPSALTGWTPLGVVIWFDAAQPSAFICGDSNICKVWRVQTLVCTVSHNRTELNRSCLRVTALLLQVISS